jgi:pimeloyl-ACP methyl ester carboxylesterase
MAAFFRRIQQFVRDQPVAAGLSAVVFVGAVVVAALAVGSGDSGDGDDTAATSTSTSSSTTTSTTAAPSTTAPTSSSAAPTTTAPPPTTPSGQRCVVRLHGKGGDGADTWQVRDVAYVSPTGNDEAWGGRQWLYFPDDEYDAAVASVAEAIESEDCGPVILNGFSNGGAFAAKLYCSGETFGGRVVRVVVDDPVVDTAVQDCDPAPGVDVTLYWTGELEGTAQPGWDCREQDWTCEGGVTIGIDAYAEALDTSALESRYDSHRWYEDAPELSDW